MMRLPTLLLRLAATALCAICLCLPSPAKAQDALQKNSEGTEFWICFQRNYRDEEIDATTNQMKPSDPLALELFVISRQTTKITVEIQDLGYKRDFEVRADAVLNIKIDTAAQLTSNERVERKAIHITAESPVTVYGLSRRFKTTDTYLALPVQTLGTQYRVMAYERLSPELVSQLAVIATEDDTKVTITPTSVTMSGKPSQKPFSFTLNRGESYQLIAGAQGGGKADFTGTEVTSSKPVAVFSGHNCAYVPTNLRACNHLVEQIPPMESWGTQFYVGSFKSRSRYTVRVLASQPNTKIFENAKLVAQINEGQYYENSNLRGNTQYTADKPVLVAQFAQGFMNGDSIGDPMMILVSPTQQFLRRYRFATPVNGAWQHYINVVIPADKASTLRLDGVPVPPSKFEPFGTSSYSIAQLEVPYGTHTLEADVSFGMYSYGFGFSKDAYDAYGNIGGQSFEAVKIPPDITAPALVMKEVKGIGFRLYASDDKPNDRGLKSVTVQDVDGMSIAVPNIVEGTPQAELAIGVPAEPRMASATLVVRDIAGNEVRKSLCYRYDASTSRWVVEIRNVGDCAVSTPVRLTAFSSFNSQSHTVNLIGSADIPPPFSFGGKQDFTTGGGIGAEWQASSLFTFLGRLSLLSSLTTLTGNTPTVLRIDNPDGTTLSIPVQLILDIPSPTLNISLGAKFHPIDYLYVVGGAQLDYQFSNRAELRMRSTTVPPYVFSNGQTESIVQSFAVESLNRTRFGLFGGVGVRVPLVHKLSVMAEFQGVYTPGSYLSDADWKVSAVRTLAGLVWEF